MYNYLLNTEGLILGCLILVILALVVRLAFGPADDTPSNDGKDIDEPTELEDLSSPSEEEVDEMFEGFAEPSDGLLEALAEEEEKRE